MSNARGNSRTQRPMLKKQIRISPWPDATIDSLGYDVRDRDTPRGHVPYVETFWLPILGPTATWLLRRCNSHLDARNPGPMPTALLSQCLGLGDGISRASKLADTIARAERFGFAFLSFQGDELRVRTHLPLLPARQTARLPDPLRALHRHFDRTNLARLDVIPRRSLTSAGDLGTRTLPPMPQR